MNTPMRLESPKGVARQRILGKIKEYNLALESIKKDALQHSGGKEITVHQLFMENPTYQSLYCKVGIMSRLLTNGVVDESIAKEMARKIIPDISEPIKLALTEVSQILDGTSETESSE